MNIVKQDEICTAKVVVGADVGARIPLAYSRLFSAQRTNQPDQTTRSMRDSFIACKLKLGIEMMSREVIWSVGRLVVWWLFSWSSRILVDVREKAT